MPIPRLPGLSDLAVVGRGGNGVVYSARQVRLGRIVAVKLIGTHLDDQAAARFAREGQALGRLSGHPNIVPVYAVDTTQSGEPYLVMQLCEGGSLADRYGDGSRMRWQDVLDLGVRMCGALQTAHNCAIMHRDIKPGNILFDGYGVPKLVDFGQARTADAQITRTGEVVATPAYGAPEVLYGRPATPRSDVYSLAATLIAALTGQTPFTGGTDENIAAVLLRVVQQPPPNVRPFGAPDPLALLLERALSKSPENRPTGAGDFGEQLRSIQRQLGLPMTPLVVGGGSESTATGVRVVGADGGRMLTPQVAPPTSQLPPYLQQPSQLAPAGPWHPQQLTDAAARPSTRRRGRWFALTASVLVLVLGAVITVFTLQPNKPRVVTSPSTILVGGSELGGNWSTTGDLDLIVNTLGEQGPDSSAIAPTVLSKCLGIDTSQVAKAKTSATYARSGMEAADSATVNKDPGTYAAKHYLVGRTVALVMKSEGAAKALVKVYSSPGFETCLDSAKDIGDPVGNESGSSSQPAKTSAPTSYNAPSGTVAQARQVAIALSRKWNDDSSAGDYKTVRGTRYVTIVVVAVGTSAMMAVFQSDEGSLPDGVLQSSLDAFADKATE
ncbi:MAG: serine/threonine-protein kinase [Antricoccus sp.]